MPGRADLRIIALFALFVAGLLAIPHALAPPAPERALARVGFDAERAVGRLARILGDQRPHPVDSEANDEVRARLLAEIEALGYAPEVRDDFSCRGGASAVFCARVRNVLFRAGPEGGGAVMVASHYDSVPAGPGAADDGLGVAVSLELAKLLADAPPSRPVIFLFTDGEEAGLFGAASFARTDPLRNEIAAVINLEARGVTGPAQMFQTSDPNGRDVAAYAAGAARPFSNSLMTDVYRMMPNDTDLTMFLPLGYDALNFAVTDGFPFYHTPRDTLENLDIRSVAHMGGEAAGALEGFLNASPGNENRRIFTDVLTRALIVAPHWAGLGAVWVGLVAAAFVFFRAKGPRPLRAALFPPAALTLAGGIVFGLASLIRLLRVETVYWFAAPWAMAALCYLAAVFAVALCLFIIGRGAGSDRLSASAWFWFAAAGAGLSFVAPGGSVLFAAPLLIFATGAAAGAFRPALRVWFDAAAALAAFVLFAPDIHYVGVTLGYGAAPVAAFSAAFIALVASPLALDADSRAGPAPSAVAGIGLALALGAALVVPAYSAAAPRPLNLHYFIDADARRAQWLVSGADEPLPPEMQALAPFEPVAIDGLAAHRGAPADFLEATPPELMVLEDRAASEGRRVRFRLIANGADAVDLRIPAEAGATGALAGGQSFQFAPGGARLLRCTGRACDGAEFEVELANIESSRWTILGIRYGLPRAGDFLVAARPAESVPLRIGDTTIVRAIRKI